MALCAYVGQTLKPERLGISPYTLEVLSLVLIVLSVFVGFKRIEVITLGALVNHEILHLGELRGTFVSHPEGFINGQSGESWDPEGVAREVTRINKVIPLRQAQMKRISKQTAKLYRWRNGLLGLGFVGLLTSKILAGYSC